MCKLLNTIILIPLLTVLSAIEIEITYNSSSPIYGFQFDVSGVTVIDASGGDAEAEGFMISSSPTRVLGFSLTGASFGPGTGIMVELEIEGNEEDACLYDLVLSGDSGVSLDADIIDCLNIVYEGRFQNLVT